MTATLAEVVSVVEELYDPATAASWDAVGLVVGDPGAPVRRVLFAVDPVEEVVDEVVAGGYDLLVTHHPLYLRGTTSVAETGPKGRVVARLVRAGAGLLVAHTNADAASPGVSDALARAVGLTGPLEPLDPLPADPLDVLVVHVPRPDADRLLDALADAGAGRLGAYDRAAFVSTGTGTFRPLEGARPAVGEVGRVERVDEARLELAVPRAHRRAVLAALHAAHPYEQPSFDLHETAQPPGRRGTGRVGELDRPEPLRALAARVARGLPATSWGLRVAGDPERPVRRVAVCGGSGDSLLGRATAVGADAYLTADLRHHPASEHDVHSGPALLDAAHWATEWPWLADAAARVRAALEQRGDTVGTAVSTVRTDPWTLHVPPRDPGETPA
ncbi:dinuclear metal center YbgI/SA1388 family protein [Motilibacter rhizosphaerae]|uniref:GTP cyclohydrolase 1 type 2 homolog n=1 Tax=Motilibacter rhizosphaerae TaxID=598652 RepID=A0A4Q7NTD0_9ACTN|nr:Nif3-like dinuclear metal center hexameric protein [Motilibacter rhizosphaerae]RZS89642.1 dinuclear metal center YbgI/SA1388 family protein [Motilibacter rhizosphaerae]